MKPLSVRALALVTACLGSLNLADAAQQPKASISPRLCIYNEPPYHYEVVLGLVHTFAPEYGANMLVYLDKSHMDGVDELFEDKLPWSHIENRVPVSQLRNVHDPAHYPIPCDVVIVATVEWNFPGIRQRILQSPSVKVVIIMVHEYKSYHLPDDVYSHHPNLYLFGLAPHVAQRLTERFNRTAYWWLPTAALDIRSRCGTQGGSNTQCPSGFAVQGYLSTQRRNYNKTFNQLANVLASTSDPRAQLLLVGKQDDNPKNWPVVPDSVAKRTKVISNLKFPEVCVGRRLVDRVLVDPKHTMHDSFYETLHHSLVLMPQIIDNRYLIEKVTSSVTTSLVAGVPMLVNSDFLGAYSYLKPKHVYLQAPHESETDTMIRILSMSDQEHTQRRAALADLRLRLQADARRKLRMLVEPFMPQIITQYNMRLWGEKSRPRL